MAESCASSGWCAALYAAHGRLAGYLPEAGQREVWASGPDVRIAASVVPPQGVAVPDGDGWRLSGRWRFASGIDHAQWVLLASSTPAPGGAEGRIFAVPRSAVTVADTWRTAGMRGTGSHAVELDCIHVPARRAVTVGTLLQARPGAEHCHTVPFPMVAALVFAAPLLGAARGALRDRLDRAVGRLSADGVPAPAAQEVLARSSAEIHAAQLLLERVAQRADSAVRGALVTAECQRDAALAAELCTAAVDRLLRGAGIGAMSEGDPLLRRWHDVSTAARHGTLAFDKAAAAYARAQFAERTRETA